MWVSGTDIFLESRYDDCLKILRRRYARKRLRLLQLPFISDHKGRQFTIPEYVYTCYGTCVFVHLFCSHTRSHFYSQSILFIFPGLWTCVFLFYYSAPMRVLQRFLFACTLESLLCRNSRFISLFCQNIGKLQTL